MAGILQKTQFRQVKKLTETTKHHIQCKKRQKPDKAAKWQTSLKVIPCLPSLSAIPHLPTPSAIRAWWTS